MSIVIMIQFVNKNLPLRQTGGISNIHQLQQAAKVFLFGLLSNCYLEKLKYTEALTAAVFEYPGFQK